MLAPTRQAELALRVRQLAQTRTEALDTGAAEIRRIERDLHDGAQARLVALGMTLDAAGQIIDTNPAAARALLFEARDASVKALAELRALVRGIHPPVLADRGLADAIQALTFRPMAWRSPRPSTTEPFAGGGDLGPAGCRHRGRPAAADLHRRGDPGRAGRAA